MGSGIASHGNAGRRIRRAAKWVGLTLVAVAIVSTVTIWFALRHPVPSRSGESRLAGLGREATVRFDARGVPHVRAATEADAYRVLGRLHAADRFFQMELRRRAAAGRLAEVLGEPLVAFDQESRRGGHVVLARSDLESLAPTARSLLAAYAEGVNEYLRTGALPLELHLLRARPEPWTALDSLAFSRFMLAGLSEAPGRELRALAERGDFHPADGFDVLPARPPAFEQDAGGRGSNAWAISGARTRGGSPILANDPHLALEVPGVWYAAHLTSDDGLDVAGLTLAGAPGVVIGHNGKVAWGITMAHIDDADVIFEPVDVRSSSVAVEGGWMPLTTRVETIRVRARPDTTLTLRSTRNGTILGIRAGDDRLGVAAVLAFAPDRAQASLAAFLRAARARTSAEIESAWAEYGGPAINLCWAASDGRFGLRIAGAVPRRVHGVDASGAPTIGWAGLVAEADLPRVTDPVDGFVASANDNWSAAGTGLPFDGSYASEDRILRLRDVLSTTDDTTPEASNALQNDVVSRYALRLVRRFGDHAPRAEDAKRAAEILRAWDGRVDRTGPGRLFHAFAAALASKLRIGTWSRLDAAFDDPVTQWDDPDTPAEETRAVVLEAALSEALARVQASDGADPERWNWGRVHRVRFEHPLAPVIPVSFVRNWLDRGPLEMPGDVHTPNVQAFRLGREPWIRHIPSARFVADLSDPDASTLVLPLGQSAHRVDPHYADQLDAWASGRTYAFPFTPHAVEAATESVLRLKP